MSSHRLADGMHDKEMPQKLLEYIKSQLHCIDIDPYKINIVGNGTGTSFVSQYDHIRDIVGTISISWHIFNRLSFDEQAYIVDHEITHIKEGDIAIKRQLDNAKWDAMKFGEEGSYYKLMELIRDHCHIREYIADGFPILEDSKKWEHALSSRKRYIEKDYNKAFIASITHPSLMNRQKFIEFLKQT